MAQVSGVATSYDLDQFVGRLFAKGVSRQPNAVLRAVGGLNGTVRTVANNRFALGVDYEHAAAAQPSIVEGAAPVYEEEDTTQAFNVTQIFQYGFALTYSRQARTAQIDGETMIPGGGAGPLQRPGTFEFQRDRKLEKLQNDVNFTIIRGTYALPATNASARTSRGIMSALTTNSINAALADTAITDKATFEGHLQTFLTNRMYVEGATLWVVGPAAKLGLLKNTYEVASTGVNVPESADVAGVRVQRIRTRWCELLLVEDPNVVATELLFMQPQFCQIVITPIPNKGLVFTEELNHTGSQTNWQLYGEIGLDYGHEMLHGEITNLA